MTTTLIRGVSPATRISSAGAARKDKSTRPSSPRKPRRVVDTSPDMAAKVREVEGNGHYERLSFDDAGLEHWVYIRTGRDGRPLPRPIRHYLTVDRLLVTKCSCTAYHASLSTDQPHVCKHRQALQSRFVREAVGRAGAGGPEALGWGVVFGEVAL